MISPGLIFIFSRFWFFELLGGSKAKNDPKWQKKLSGVPYISGTIDMIVIFGTHV